MIFQITHGCISLTLRSEVRTSPLYLTLKPTLLNENRPFDRGYKEKRERIWKGKTTL